MSEVSKISKYGQSIGFWNLKVGGADFQLKPKKGDNLKLMDLINKSKNNNDEFFKNMMEFIKGIISRDYKPETPNEIEELDMYVEFNIIPLVQETMIAFRWTTREAMDKIANQEDLAKKFLDRN